MYIRVLESCPLCAVLNALVHTAHILSERYQTYFV